MGKYGTQVILKELSADEKAYWEEYYREKRLHDEASALGYARREGKIEGRAEGRAEGIAEGRIKGRAEGKIEGMAEKSAQIAEKMRRLGYTEEEIKALID